MTRTAPVRTFEAWRISLFALIATLVLVGLAALVTPPPEQAARPPEAPGDRPERRLAGSFLHHFGGPHDEAEWYKSDFYYPNSGHPAWKAGLIHFEKDRIELEVRRERTAYKTIAGA